METAVEGCVGRVTSMLNVFSPPLCSYTGGFLQRRESILSPIGPGVEKVQCLAF
jgi:hypothetical protein